IGEQGLTLSGGQRQRVSLARALITDPAILVLDDATSAIDAGIEAQIHATLRHVMAGRTTLLIAHRRSTLQLADRLAVLDDGRVTGAPARTGRSAAGGGGGHWGSMLAGIPASPELLAKVDALPPASDLPGVGQSWSRAADPRFTLTRLLRPVALALFIGLVLD